MSSNLGVDTKPGVHLGFWTNWTKGRVLGATLTLTQQDGALLIAFLAMLVAFVGSRLWKIACYITHYCLSSKDGKDALYHQRQAVLRNSDTATSALVDWARLGFAWRHNGRGLLLRIGPLVAFSALILSTFTTAGILSSRIASMTGREVLVRSDACGVNILGHYIPGQDKNPEVTSKQLFTTILPFLAQRLVYYFDYAQRCYKADAISQGCNLYVKPMLPSVVDRAATCPFGNEMCLLKDSNIRIDTGYLNSAHDLGFNTPPSERFLYRRITHCAPLVSEGYTGQRNFSTPGFERPYSLYKYGAAVGSTLNATYMYPQNSLAEYEFSAQLASSEPADYTIAYGYTDVINGSISYDHSFMPIDPLLRTDADVTLVFLSANQIIYFLPVDDPWYSAHQTIPGFKLNFTGWSQGIQLTGHFADRTVSTLGCAKQYQICYPDSQGQPQHCSRLGGKQELKYLLASLPQGPRLRNMTEWSIMAALTGNELDAFVETLGAGSLTARYKLVSGYQGPLPDNQWQLDVEHWHASTLAAIQGSAVDAATGPASPDMRQYWVPPENEQQQYLCNNQKILSSAHANFSVIGLALTVGLGGIVIAVSIALGPTVTFFQERYDRNTYARLEWCANGTLQLQRLAHEEIGAGTWKHCTNPVPVCEVYETLAGLDIESAHHPKLVRPLPAANDLSSSNSSLYKPPSKVDVSTQSKSQIDHNEEVAASKFDRPVVQTSNNKEPEMMLSGIDEK